MHTFPLKKYIPHWLLVLLSITAILLGMVLLVFQPYLTGERLFVFIGVGQDFLLSSWPSYLLTQRILLSGEFPIFSLSLGFGTNVFAGSLRRTSVVDPFAWILFLSNPDSLTAIVPWIVALKVILAGVLFFLFLKLKGLQNFSAFMGAVFYGFCGQMLIRSGWYHYTTEVVFIPLLLISLYFFVAKKRWLGLLLTLTWLGCYHSYYLVMYSLFSLIFLTFEYWKNTSGTLREYFFLIRDFCVVASLSVLLSAAIFLPNVANLLESSRLSTLEPQKVSQETLDQNTWHTNIFVNGQLFQTALARFFSNDSLGPGREFVGWGNYLEAPILYAGLLCLIFVAIIPLTLKKRQKWIALGMILFSAAYLFLPVVTNIVGAFYGLRYKTSGFFVSVFILILATQSLDEFLRRKYLHKEAIRIFLLSYFPLLAFITLLFITKQHFLPGDITWYSSAVKRIIVFLFLYPFLLLLWTIGKKKKVLQYVLGTVILLEVFTFGVITLQRRVSLNHSSFQSQMELVDRTQQIVNELRQNDPSFHRIEKDFDIFGDYGPNDPAAVGFYGTSIYYSFNSSSFTRFTDHFRLTDEGFAHRFFAGFSHQDVALRRLLGVKYYLAKQVVPAELGYTPIGQAGEITIWQDPAVIPFGSGFTAFTHPKNLEGFELAVQKQLLNHFMVLPEQESTPAFLYQDQFTPDQLATTAASPTTFPTVYSHEPHFTHVAETSLEWSNNFPEPVLVLLPLAYDPGWKLTVDGQPHSIILADYGLMAAEVPAGEHHYVLSYHQPYLRLGLFISALTFCGLVAYWAMARRQKPRTSHPQ